MDEAVTIEYLYGLELAKLIFYGKGKITGIRMFWGDMIVFWPGMTEMWKLDRGQELDKMERTVMA